MKNGSLGTKLLMAAVTLALLAYFGMQGYRYFADPFTTTMAYNYLVEDSLSVTGYVVRSEEILPDSGDGLLRLTRAEGERVSTGGTVGVVYADQASLDRQEEIDGLNAQLEQLRFAQDAAVGSEVSLKLDSQIMDSLLTLRSDLTAGRLSAAEEQVSSLRSLVMKRDYTYTETEDLSGRIQELEAQVKSLESQSAGTVQRITAPDTGIYSAVVDGYESLLTPETLDTLTPSALNSLQADSSLTSRVGKLIHGDDWYYAVSLTAAEAEALQASGGVTLRFTKDVERDLEVTLESLGPEENGRVVAVLRGDTYLSRLTLLRRQSAELILKGYTGVRVPRAAIRAEKAALDEEGNRVESDAVGVYCVVGMRATFKPVEILYQGEDFAVVAGTGTTEKTRLRAGDEVIVTANDLYDGKVVGQAVE